jgi:hypothetical protein
MADMLGQHGHEVVTAGEVRLATASDDDVTVWADELQGALVTMDRGFHLRAGDPLPQ